MSTPLTATQVQHPWKAAVRTGIQTAVPTLIVLISIISIVQDNFKDQLPAEFIAWLSGASALLVALSVSLSRIMAIPGVNEWLTTLGLGATPKQITDNQEAAENKSLELKKSEDDAIYNELEDTQPMPLEHGTETKKIMEGPQY